MSASRVFRVTAHLVRRQIFSTEWKYSRTLVIVRAAGLKWARHAGEGTPRGMDDGCGTHMEPVFHISSSTTSRAACTKNWFCWFCAESSLCKKGRRQRLRQMACTVAAPGRIASANSLRFGGMGLVETG